MFQLSKEKLLGAIKSGDTQAAAAVLEEYIGNHGLALQLMLSGVEKKNDLSAGIIDKIKRTLADIDLLTDEKRAEALSQLFKTQELCEDRITFEAPKNPVTLTGHQWYDRDADGSIKNWVEDKGIDPITGETVNITDYINTEVFAREILRYPLHKNKKLSTKIAQIIELINADKRTLVDALSLAIELKQPEIAESLLMFIPASDVTSDAGTTLLVLAIQHTQDKLANELIKRGAKLDSALSFSRKNNNHSLTQLLEQKIASLQQDLLKAVTENKPRKVRQLLRLGASINHVTKDGKTLLHVAASGGCSEVAQYLIIKGAPVNARSNDGLTPLHLASQNGNRDTIQCMLKNQPESTRISLAGENKEATLRELLGIEGAIRCSLSQVAAQTPVTGDGETWYDHDRLKQWLAIDSVDPATRQQATIEDYASLADIADLILHPNAHIGRYPRLVKFIQQTEQRVQKREERCCLTRSDYIEILAAHPETYLPTQLDHIKKTTSDSVPLIYIAAKKGHEKLVDFLIQAGESLEEAMSFAQKEEDSDTVAELQSTQRRMGEAFLDAAERGKNHTLDILLKSGIRKPASSDPLLEKALCVAVEAGHTETAELLLRSGARLNMALEIAKHEKTPSDTVISHIESKIKAAKLAELTAAAKQGNKAKIKALVRNGMNIGAAIAHLQSTTLRLKPKRRKHIRIQSAIKQLQKQADALGQRLLDKNTLSKPETVRALLEQGASPDLQDARRNSTPLHIAANNNNQEAVRLLLLHKADTNKKNREGDSPLFRILRKRGDHRRIVELFAPSKADLEAASLKVFGVMGRTLLNYQLDVHNKLFSAIENENLDELTATLQEHPNTSIIGEDSALALKAAYKKNNRNIALAIANHLRAAKERAPYFTQFIHDALSIAAKAGHTEAMQALSPDLSQHAPALMYQACLTDDIKTIQALKTLSIDYLDERRCHYKWGEQVQPMCDWNKGTRIKTMKLLGLRGPLKNLRATPLLLAAKKGSIAVFMLLLKTKLDIYIAELDTRSEYKRYKTIFGKSVGQGYSTAENKRAAAYLECVLTGNDDLPNLSNREADALKKGELGRIANICRKIDDFFSEEHNYGSRLKREVMKGKPFVASSNSSGGGGGGGGGVQP